MSETRTEPPARRSGRSWRVDLLLALAVLALAAPFLREWSTQPASRYLFTASIVDDHSFRLDPYRESLGQDYALIGDHTYSDKAPYQPLLSVPIYWLYRQAGGEAFPPGVAAIDVGHREDIGVWLVTLWSATLPAVALIIVMRRHVARFFAAEAVPVALAMVFGTVLLPFSSLLFGHMLAALTGFAAWFVLRREPRSTGTLLLTGVLLGAGVGVEYPQVVTAAVVGIYGIVVVRWRAAWIALGGFVGMLPLFIVNALIFGGPLKTAYQGYLGGFQGSGAFGVYNLVAPDPRQFGLALIGDRGLFSLTPVMVVAVLGGIRSIRLKGRARPDAIVAFVLLALYLLVSTGIDGYGGSSPGPRYLVPIVPFFAVPLAEAWTRWRPLAVVAAVWSAIWMVLATLTDPLYSAGGQARADWLGDLFGGRFDGNLLGGGPAVLVMVVVAAACGAAAIVVSRRDTGPPGAGSASSSSRSTGSGSRSPRPATSSSGSG